MEHSFLTVLAMQLDPEDKQVVMQLVDKDRDGVVSLEDFRAFMHHALSSRGPADDCA
jgi:Ca2+-binding EF-hand superfamily protein